jgi:hypothetical protein
VATIQVGLLLNKSRHRKKGGGGSCYTNYMAATSVHSSHNTWPQKRGLIVTQITCPQQTDRRIVFKLCNRKKNGLFVTHIIWPQQTDLLFPNYVAAKQTSLFLHKIRSRNQRTYCSSIKWTQNKRAYCYTNNILFPKYEETKQAGLVLHKLCGHNKRNYCSSTNCLQNKRAFCYTHYVAARNRFIVPQQRGFKTSGLILHK